jgi:hypothetical protein
MQLRQFNWKINVQNAAEKFKCKFNVRNTAETVQLKD